MSRNYTVKWDLSICRTEETVVFKGFMHQVWGKHNLDKTWAPTLA